MSNPVGGSGDPNQPPLSPNLEGDPSNRVASVANEVFSRSEGASSLHDPLSGRVSAGEVRPSKEDILNEWLASQPENAKAEAKRILAILRQKNLDNLFELELGNLKNITSLPNVLQNCTNLVCSFCTSLQALPELPVCIVLNCRDCTSLQTLPKLPVCKLLNCMYCTSLQALPKLGVCTNLVCSYCPSLQALPELPVCTELSCYNCTRLRALPELPDCTTLNCSDCTSLQALPELPVCTRLHCMNCTSLQALPELPACTNLVCSFCTSLRTLPRLPACTKLYCNNCTSLQALSAELPVCSQIFIRACPSLQNLPPLPSCMSLVLADCLQLRSIPDVPEGCNIDMRNCPLIPSRFDSAPAQQPNPYQGQIDRAAQGTLQDALSFWSGLLPQGEKPLPRAEALKFDDNTRARDQRLFQIFLNRLQETADFRQASPQNRQNFALRVATIVRDMVASEEFCQKAIWALDSANTACGDRVATGIESLEILSLIHGQNKPKEEVDAACLAIRLDRLDRVSRKAIALNPGPEGLETVLYLELALKDRLQLPLQTKGMLYPGTGRVSDEAVERTAQEILAATSTDEQLVDILVKSSVWTDFLQRKYAFFYADVLEGLEIIANLAEGTDYAANLAALEKEPTSDWINFLKNLGPPNASPKDREALQSEVLQALREACPSLTGKDYNTAYNQLIQQIHKKKTIEWLRANRDALRARLNP